MAAMSDYLENKILDHIFKSTTFTSPTVAAVALFFVNKGQRANSTLYTVTTDYIWLTANDTKTHCYKCTTGGTTAASQSTLYPGVANEAITDGGAVFTEVSSLMDANSLTALEVSTSGTGYGRQTLNPSATANWVCTQGGVTAPSSGSNGTTSNNTAITFGSPVATWGGAGAMVAMMGVYDNSVAGNLLFWGFMTIPKSINNGDAAPSFAGGALTFQVDN